MTTYAQLKRRHPDYDAGYWRTCQAFYEGGKALFGDKKFLESVFPKHNSEQAQVYEERKARAYYLPYPAEIIGDLVASLFSEPISMGSEPPANQDFYKDFYEATSTHGSEPLSFNQLLRKQIETALIKQTAWSLVDFPRSRDGMIPFSRKDEEDLGLDRAYCLPISPENIIDWEEDEGGKLVWAMILVCSTRRETLGDDRNSTVETYTYYTRDSWQRFVVKIKRDENGSVIDCPKDSDEISEDDSGTHTFGSVPLVRLTLPDGLWAMNKIVHVAKEHFNKECALSWAEFKSLFQQLYEFLGPEEAAPGQLVGENGSDPNRALLTRRGPGYVQQRGDKDRAEYVGPDTQSFEFAMKKLDRLRDECHRILNAMALSVDNKVTAIARSGVSKAHDRANKATILQALGDHVRSHAEALYKLISKGRGEDIKWNVHGMESFDSMDVSDAIEQAAQMSLVEVRSPTFHRAYQYGLARLILGPSATLEQLKNIKLELETNVTSEEHSADFANDIKKAKAGILPEDQEGDGEGAKSGNKTDSLKEGQTVV